MLHVLRPPGVVYVQTTVCTLWALSRAKITRAKNSSSNSSTFSEVLSLLSFTTPLDSLRSRVAPFTFFNRYTFVTLHVTPRTYITSVARIYNALPPRKLHICVLLRIRTPTTTPLPNGRKSLITTNHVRITQLGNTLHILMAIARRVCRSLHNVQQRYLPPLRQNFVNGLTPYPFPPFSHPFSATFIHFSHHFHTNVTQTCIFCYFSHQFSRFLSLLLHIIYNVITRIL